MVWIIIIAVALAIVLPAIIIFIVLWARKTLSQYEAPPRLSPGERVGIAGENYVAKYLSSFASVNNGYLYNDYCFEDDDGYSTEIDHIVVTKGGLFIIETKTNKGTIYGKDTDEKWECRKWTASEDKLLKNPIKQNQGHINHLKKMLGNKTPKIYSVIIFPVADITNVAASNVYNLNGALSYIRDITDKGHYNQSFVEQINGRLSFIKEKYGISKERHINNINRIYH